MSVFILHNCKISWHCSHIGTRSSTDLYVMGYGHSKWLQNKLLLLWDKSHGFESMSGHPVFSCTGRVDITIRPGLTNFSLASLRLLCGCSYVSVLVSAYIHVYTEPFSFLHRKELREKFSIGCAGVWVCSCESMWGWRSSSKAKGRHLVSCSVTTGFILSRDTLAEPKA